MDEARKNGVPGNMDEPEDLNVQERRRWLFFGLPFTFTVYRLTARKLTVKTGLFTTVEDDILLYRVMDTSYRRSLWQKLFGLGSIQIASSDHSMPELVIRNIRGAREFKDLLDGQIEKERIRLRFRAGEYTGMESEDCSCGPDDMPVL